MLRAYFASLTLLGILVANAPAWEPPTSDQAPGLFKVTAIDKDSIELKGAADATHRAALQDLEIYDSAGKKLKTEDLLKRVKVGSVVLVAADENKVDPSYLAVLKGDTVVLVGVAVVLARADKPGRGWTLDLDKMKPSDNPVAGKIYGADYNLDKIQLVVTGLSLWSGKDWIHMFLNLKPGEGIAGKSYLIKAEDPQGQGRPAIHFHIHSSKLKPAAVNTSGYAMRLEFGMEKDGTIPGKLYLCLPDERKSWIAGSFTLTIR
jgi:hypothetical protein